MFQRTVRGGGRFGAPNPIYIEKGVEHLEEIAAAEQEHDVIETYENRTFWHSNPKVKYT